MYTHTNTYLIMGSTTQIRKSNNIINKLQFPKVPTQTHSSISHFLVSIEYSTWGKKSNYVGTNVGIFRVYYFSHSRLCQSLTQDSFNSRERRDQYHP